jgi:hypothetical protein
MPTPPPFLDTNVILRHLLNDVPEQSARARALLLRIEAGELRVRTAETVVFEIVFTLQRVYKKTPQEMRCSRSWSCPPSACRASRSSARRSACTWRRASPLPTPTMPRSWPTSASRRSTPLTGTSTTAPASRGWNRDTTARGFPLPLADLCPIGMPGFFTSGSLAGLAQNTH